MNGNKIHFRLAAYTDPAGKWNEDAPKKGNEDDLFVDADLSNEVQGQFMADEVIRLSEAGCLMAVADGMGGMNAGEVASAIAIQTVKSAFCKDSLTDKILSSAASRTKYLENVIVEADAAIKKKSHEDKECEGMGSTLILAWLYDNELTVTWCGDSRAYLFRDTDGIRQISKDHSYVQGLVDAGSITEVEAFDHPYGNIITRSLGDPEKKAQPESVTVPVCKGDIIMLCSDGLSGVLRDRKFIDDTGDIIPADNLEDIIRANRSSMTECREALWSAAENADWYDNVTAILCEIVDGEENKMIRSQEYHDGGGSLKENINKSFLNIRIHKKGLKIAGFIVAAIFVSAAAYFVGSNYIHPNPKKGILTQIDSLQKESESLGLILIYNKLNGLNRDKVDTSAFESIQKEFKERLLALSELDSLSKRAEYLGLSGTVTALSALKDSVRISEAPEYDIQKLSASIEEADSLQNKIKEFLGQYQHMLSTKQKQKIESYRISLSEKEQIDKNDMKEWDKLSKQAIVDIQPIVNQAATAQGEDKLEESSPSLTPAVDINF